MVRRQGLLEAGTGQAGFRRKGGRKWDLPLARVFFLWHCLLSSRQKTIDRMAAMDEDQITKQLRDIAAEAEALGPSAGPAPRTERRAGARL